MRIIRRTVALAGLASVVAALPMTAAAQGAAQGAEQGAAQGAEQNAEQKAIIAVVDKLFDGMRTRDTAAMRALFVPEARMHGVGRGGQFTANPIDQWLSGIGRQSDGPPWIERTWAHEVRVESNIAQAWMQYDFSIGERLSHCGVDAFNFVKLGADWKIVSVMDTRRTTGCTPPPAGRLP